MHQLKEKVSMSLAAADELVLAIHDWFEEKLVLARPEAPRLTAAQALSVRYLFKLQVKISGKAAAAAQKKKPKLLQVSLSLEEILAVRLCITCRPGEFLLQQLLGDIQQRSLNFDYLVELTT